MKMLLVITGLCFVLSVVDWVIHMWKFKGSGFASVTSFLISIGACVFPYLIGKYNIL